MSEITPLLSVVFPLFNEESRLHTTFSILKPFLERKDHFIEFIFSNDGSTDASGELIETFIRENSTTNCLLRAIHYPSNRGKGAAVRQGVLAATGEWVAFTDIDLAVPLEVIESFLALDRTNLDAVIGVRSEELKDRKFLRDLSGKIFSVIRQVFVPGFRDSQCPFKAFRREVGRSLFNDLQLEGFGFDLEILKKLRKSGARYREMEVPFRDIPGSKIHPLKTPLELVWDLIRTLRI